MSRETGMQPQTVRVAAIQAAPILFERAASIEKASELIRQAGARGARLVLLPEAFVPGYPRGFDFEVAVGDRGEQGRRDWARYRSESIIVPGPDTELLGEAARAAGAFVAVGVIERSREPQGGTVYCSLLYFGPDGRLLGKHRKLKPTAANVDVTNFANHILSH